MWTLPWRRQAAPLVTPERKQAGGVGFVALHLQAEANWARRDYASLAREGFMRNPVAHRCVRMIAEAAASAPWLMYEGVEERSIHPLLDLMQRPNPRQGGGAFM